MLGKIEQSLDLVQTSREADGSRRIEDDCPCAIPGARQRKPGMTAISQPRSICFAITGK